MTSKPSKDWLLGAEACGLLHVTRETLAKLVASGRIGTFSVSNVRGCLYCRADVERIVSESVRPARTARELVTV